MKHTLSGLLALAILGTGFFGILSYGWGRAATVGVTTSTSTSITGGVTNASSVAPSTTSSKSSTKSSSPSSLSSKKSSSTSSMLTKPCCVCMYYDVPWCDGKPKIECGDHPDCTWQKNTCIPRFQKMCDDWMGGQSQCGTKMVKKELDPAPDLSMCRNVTYERMGHGYECDYVSKQIRTCLRSCKNSTCTTYTDVGCSTASNLEEARQYIAKIQKDFAKEGKTITVTLNQTFSHWPTCQTYVKYTITASSVKEDYIPCDPGGFCFITGNPMTCKEKDGSLVTQKCCSCGKEDVWSNHGVCPAVEDGDWQTYNETRWEVGKECKKASEDVLAAAKEHIRKFGENCDGSISTDIGWPPEVKIAVGKDICTATAQFKYRCSDICMETTPTR